MTNDKKTFKQHLRVLDIVRRITSNVMGVTIGLIVRVDTEFTNKEGGARIYLQAEYLASCVKSGLMDRHKGRKWHLSQYMTDDEIVKTAYAAVKMAVEHEIMEGFTVDGDILFNPHANYESILKASKDEIKRE